MIAAVAPVRVGFVIFALVGGVLDLFLFNSPAPQLVLIDKVMDILLGFNQHEDFHDIQTLTALYTTVNVCVGELEKEVFHSCCK